MVSRRCSFQTSCEKSRDFRKCFFFNSVVKYFSICSFSNYHKKSLSINRNLAVQIHINPLHRYQTVYSGDSLQVGPTLCTYFYSLTIFRRVLVAENIWA